jgi:hypothetical protein
LPAHGIFVVDAAAVGNFDAIFGEVGEEGIVAALPDIRGEMSFELEQEIGTLGGFFCLGERRGGEKERKENCDGDPVHRNFSGRSGGALGYVRR